MEDEQKSKPLLTAAAEAAQARRDALRAEALRANLRRRKAQERGRADAPSETPPTHKLFQDISE